MRLRKQLLFLSLVTLALPWVGCQYIRDMDTTLRNGHSQALHASAAAVSAHIANDPKLLSALNKNLASANALYAHPLATALLIDGYDDDWLSQGYTYQRLSNLEDQAPDSAILGTHDKGLYLMMKLDVASKHYFNPSQSTLAHCDYLFIKLGSQEFALLASAPGQVTATRLQQGTLSSQAEHQIRGFWFENKAGYQIEFALPLNWAMEGMFLRFYRAGQTAPEIVSDEVLIRHSPELASALGIFAERGITLRLTNTSGHILAKAESLPLAQETQQHGFIEWLYRLALGKQQFAPLSTQFPGGQLPANEIRAALQGQTQGSWYQRGSEVLARVAHPVRDQNQAPIGVVMVEQSVDALTGLTNSAFNRLLGYSFLASTFAGVCLVLYATWLSLRIRRLSQAAANAISDRGEIASQFPVSKSADEIGELSRNYSQLLARLREYTEYLRSLSNKLSHELRTPLAIVKSSLDNLEQEPLSEQAQTYADRAREGATRLANILNAMSAASGVEQALSSSEREVINCAQLLGNLQSAYRDVYAQHRFELTIDGDPHTLKVQGAGELLVQAMDKLVDNAADFCPSSGRIALGLRRQHHTVVFSVYNQGPSLPSHMQHQLFDSLVSIRDQSTQGQADHLGLGLYIVRLITQFHQGEVRAFNAPDGSGVVFEMRLPAAR